MLGATAPPARASCRHLIVDVLDQGGLSSCVANAGFQAIRASHMRQGVKKPKLGSRLFGYYLARAYGHTTGFDSGTHLRAFFAAVNKFGFPPEDMWPYSDDQTGDTPQFTRMPSSTAFRSAFDQRAPTLYRRIYEEGEARLTMVRRAVAAGHVICFGTDVSRDFVDGLLGTEPLRPPAVSAGGHAMCIAEYDMDAFGIVNSWGRGFGDDGWCRFSDKYIAWSGARDFWIVESSPRFSE